MILTGISVLLIVTAESINLGVFTIYKYYISKPNISPTSWQIDITSNVNIIVGKFTVFASLLLLFGFLSLRFGEATPGEFNYNGVYNDS